MLKKTLISCAMIGAVALAAVASSGGGRKSESPLKANYTPIKTTNGFTLKAGPSYTGSHIFSTLRSNNAITYNTVVTYQKGNNTIIVPQQVKMTMKPTASFKSNLNLLDLKIKLHK